MKQKRNILLPALLAPVFVALGSGGEHPSYHPDEGTVLSKRSESASEISLDDMTMVMNGQEIDQSMFGMEMTTSTKVIIAITDSYVAMSGGQPAELSRTFDELTSTTEVAMSNQMMGDMDSEMDGSSDLEGLTVVFTWDPDEEEYEVSFADGSEGDEDLLEGLVENMDLRNMLPADTVSEGDTWEIDPETLRHVFAPCGAVKIQPEELEEMMGMSPPTPSPDAMLGEFEGEVSAKFEGTRDEDGVRVAVINVAIDVSTAKDMTELMEDMMGDMEIPGAGEMEMDIESFDMEFAFEGEGVLLWNMETGLLHSFDLSGEVSQTLDTAMNMAMGEMEQSIEQSMALSGSQSVTITTE